jgi:exodeoxyribonuclease-3
MEKLEEFILFSDADIIGLQETKTNEPAPIDDLLSMGYFADWNFAKRLGYSGTLCLFKEKPLKITRGFGVKELDGEGRVITLEYPAFYLSSP